MLYHILLQGFILTIQWISNQIHTFTNLSVQYVYKSYDLVFHDQEIILLTVHLRLSFILIRTFWF